MQLTFDPRVKPPQLAKWIKAPSLRYGNLGGFKPNLHVGHAKRSRLVSNYRESTPKQQKNDPKVGLP